MPSSYVDNFAPIVKAIIAFAPKSVLDIGPGWGKYGLACREYLGITADCIEVPEGRNPIQDHIYGRRFYRDVRSLFGEFRHFPHWDLALLIDVIEHMPKADGHALIDELKECKTAVLVSTPKKWIGQNDHLNPHENHVTFWKWDDLTPHGPNIQDLSTIDSLIYLIRP